MFVKEEKACVPLHDGTGRVYEMKEGVGCNQAACCTEGISRVWTVFEPCLPRAMLHWQLMSKRMYACRHHAAHPSLLKHFMGVCLGAGLQ